MTNNNGKSKRTGKSSKKKAKKPAKCLPQLLKVIKDYFKRIKKKRTRKESAS